MIDDAPGPAVRGCSPQIAGVREVLLGERRPREVNRRPARTAFQHLVIQHELHHPSMDVVSRPSLVPDHRSVSGLEERQALQGKRALWARRPAGGNTNEQPERVGQRLLLG